MAEKVTFAVGTGRCGTHLFAELFSHDSAIASFHEESRGAAPADSFVRYALWNRIPLDLSAYLEVRTSWIEAELGAGRSYFEANAYLSSLIDQLYSEFSAQFIFLIRNPEAVVTSHIVKGWYQEIPAREDAGRPWAPRPDQQLHHSLGRIMPNGKEFERWSKLTKVGKLAWWWDSYNLLIDSALKEIPTSAYRMQKLEELDYQKYLELHRFVGGKSPLSEKRFGEIISDRPGRGKDAGSQGQWSALERKEFESETRRSREHFRYV